MCSILLVDYNSIDKTLDYIDVCIDTIKYEGEINFIINDNSSIDSLTKLEERFGEYEVKESNHIGLKTYHFTYKDKRILYCFSNANLGFAKGNNNCIKLSEEFFSSDYYLISNNDIAFQETIELEEMISIFHKDHRISVIGPRVIGSDGNDQSPRRDISAFESLIKTYWCAATYKLFKKVISGLNYDGTNKRCYWVVGCFMLARADYLKACDYLDENTFLFGEEMILAERLHMIDKYMYFYSNITVFHEESTIINNSVSYISKAQTMFDSKLYFYKKYKNLNIFIEWLAKLNFKILKFFYKISRRLINQ